MAASYVAASPHTNNLLLPLAVAAHMGSAGTHLGLCWWDPALGTSAHLASAAGPGQLPVQPCTANVPRRSFASYCFFRLAQGKEWPLAGGQRSSGSAGGSGSMWAAGLSCLQTLGMFLHGMGQDLPPASLDV